MTGNDPEDRDDVDHQIRINELKEQVRELTGEEPTCFEDKDAPPEIIEQFWQNVLDTERGGWTSARKELGQEGVSLPAPAELSDAELPAKLAEIFTRLAAGRTFFLHTNHLSDRELYEHLQTELLDEEFMDMRADSPSGDGVYIIDLVGSGSEEDTLTYFRYYAEPRDRQSWQKDFPDDKLPPREQPPYDRDRLLPQPPEGW